MKILAIDTATEACSVALWSDGAVIERWQHAPREHANLVLQFVDDVLGESGCALQDMAGIAFSAGPGAFTGVRIATACAQGLAVGADLPLLPVSTLATMALGACRRYGVADVAVALDARMSEVYWGCYRIAHDQVQSVVPDTVCAPHKVGLPSDGNWTGVGNGWSVYDKALQGVAVGRVYSVYSELWPAARDAAVLGAKLSRAGGGVAPELAQPIYLRDNVTS